MEYLPGDISENDNGDGRNSSTLLGGVQSNNRSSTPKWSQQEQLLHWKNNRRLLEDQERVKLLMDIEELSIQKPNNGGASRARNASPSCFCRS
ncbi:uncharacterized protein LOC141693307 isoform X2 [Apium graveolens]|uniref:uncharacterized protein LOC141693307 isoform X2 n=1 Tax=Apium graveolens TaxID=4045 RepID=UPI003D7AA046